MLGSIMKFAIGRYIYVGVIAGLVGAGWYAIDAYVYAPKRLNITLRKEIETLRKESLVQSKTQKAKIESLKAELQKAKDDLRTTYEDGRKQGEADAVFKKCINFDAFSV